MYSRRRLTVGLWMFIGHTLGHRNSNFNLAEDRRLHEGNATSINAPWQCNPPDPSETSPVAAKDTKDYHLRGVNLGSWMVLEPWITPSMFFQFLGKDDPAEGNDKEDVGMDMYTFCQALGPEEGNKQLRRHWKTWVRDVDIADLATSGVDTIRLPVGDWMYQPYGPYVGCTEGALDEVDRLLDLCRRYDIRVLLDIHALAGSQNGLDNSGQSMDVEWTTHSGSGEAETATFVHWPLRSARWMGDFNRSTGTYSEKDNASVAHTLLVIQTMVDLYANESMVMGLEPVNEPWQFTPINWLKDFYWDAYQIVREQAPHWLFLMHDSFNFDPRVWGDFMKNCPGIGLDTHVYQAWNTPGSEESYLTTACDVKDAIETMEAAGMPVVVGEWSLATDNCAMWLNGFNDNLQGFPQVPCRYVRCPLPYMGEDQPGAPVNPNLPPLGPFGTGWSTPSYGNCPIDGFWQSEDGFMMRLAHAKLHAFEAGHGWFFWNFRTELEVRWDYIGATKKGYFPFHVDTLGKNENVIGACNYSNKHFHEGMPPGIYAEDDDRRMPMNGVLPFLLGAAAFVVVFGGVKAAMRFGNRGGWQPVSENDALENEGATVGYGGVAENSQE